MTNIERKGDWLGYRFRTLASRVKTCQIHDRFRTKIGGMSVAVRLDHSVLAAWLSASVSLSPPSAPRATPSSNLLKLRISGGRIPPSTQTFICQMLETSSISVLDINVGFSTFAESRHLNQSLAISGSHLRCLVISHPVSARGFNLFLREMIPCVHQLIIISLAQPIFHDILHLLSQIPTLEVLHVSSITTAPRPDQYADNPYPALRRLVVHEESSLEDISPIVFSSRSRQLQYLFFRLRYPTSRDVLLAFLDKLGGSAHRRTVESIVIRAWSTGRFSSAHIQHFYHSISNFPRLKRFQVDAGLDNELDSSIVKHFIQSCSPTLRTLQFARLPRVSLFCFLGLATHWSYRRTIPFVMVLPRSIETNMQTQVCNPRLTFIYTWLPFYLADEARFHIARLLLDAFPRLVDLRPYSEDPCNQRRNRLAVRQLEKTLKSFPVRT
jgi:hypothetical protein